jgi:endonuclease III related protein
MPENNKLVSLYDALLKEHGPQGWWPIDGKYHPGDYSYPRNDKERFEICAGAILTQNTAWKNVEKALDALRKEKLLDALKISNIETAKLVYVIRPAGYYNQKAKKLRIFAEFYVDLKGKTPTREQLLALWGIGPETADSILLYAFRQPSFVVDTYTKRILTNIGLIENDAPYDDVHALFMKHMRHDHRIFNEYHALFVAHAKIHYSKEEDTKDCPLLKDFAIL